MILESDFEVLENCPWCGHEQSKLLYQDKYESQIVKCQNCELVFAKRRFNKTGLSKYWKNYHSKVHVADENLVEQRQGMYKLEFEYINNMIQNGKKCKVLDVGCGGGYFLDFFRENEYSCYGVEFGKEAAEVASKKYEIWEGDFSKLQINEKFDLIIFRGVLQYIPFPKEYLDKAVSLLNNGGYIYITSTPNVDSFCFKLFKEQFSQPVTISGFIGFAPQHFINYFNEIGMKNIGKNFFYEETPYAKVEEDIKKVYEAIKLKETNKEITFKSPSFWGNMMSLVFKK